MRPTEICHAREKEEGRCHTEKEAAEEIYERIEGREGRERHLRRKVSRATKRISSHEKEEGRGRKKKMRKKEGRRFSPPHYACICAWGREGEKERREVKWEKERVEEALLIATKIFSRERVACLPS